MTTKQHDAPFFVGYVGAKTKFARGMEYERMTKSLEPKTSSFKKANGLVWRWSRGPG